MERGELKERLLAFYAIFNQTENATYKTLKVRQEELLHSDFVDVLLELPILESLHIDNVDIRDLPSSLYRLPELKSISLHRCQRLRRIPKVLYSIESLEKLHIGFSKVRKISSDIANLRGLTSFTIEASRVKAIPSEFCQLSALKFVSFYGNRIKDLPSGFSCLTEIEFLSLAVNPLREIPKSLFKLSRLKTLSLEGSQINYFPPDLLKALPFLEELRLHGNPITNLPPSITTYNWDRGGNILDDVKAYFGMV